MTYQRVQKSCSWTPQSQKKPSRFTPPPIVVQPKPISAPTQEQQMPPHTPLPADWVHPLLRSMSTDDPIQANTEAAMRQSESAVNDNAFMSTEPRTLQRQCESCEPELSEEKEKQPIQAKLTLGQPGDKYEQEADAVARQVVDKIHAPGTNGSVQRQSEEDALPGKGDIASVYGVTPRWGSADNIPVSPYPPVFVPSFPVFSSVMRHSEGSVGEGASVTQEVEQGIQQAKGGGQGLSETIREPMEQAFGADFSGVKVHTDGQSDRLNRSINARAFTTGQDVFFKQGEYNPQSKTGQELLAHELTHVVQQTGAVQQKQDTSQNGNKYEQESARVVEQDIGIAIPVNRQPIQQRIQEKEELVQLTPTSDAIKSLLSYSFLDWAVNSIDEYNILKLLRKDPDLSATVADLHSDGMLKALLTRVDETGFRHELLQLLGAGLNATARSLVEPEIKPLGQQWELQFNLGRLGVTAAAPAFNEAPFKSLISSDPSAPFTGVGATGVNPTTLNIDPIDKVGLAVGNAGTTARYSNPLPGSLLAYLSTLSPQQRAQQAELMLRQKISSVMADSYEYGRQIPSRDQVIRAAARTHNLHPELLAAFLLAEQRDQSKNEDAKDYLGATSLLQGNTSIGLGQVVVSTAKNNDLFADLLSSETRKGLDHKEIAERLASDEFNIFASARYIRKVANDGSKISIAKLPNTQKEFPGIDMAAYAANSSTWPDDNIRALASEYTSKAWDDSVSGGWAYFVFEAYQDVKASGVF
jgi:hypothetical protein